MEREKMMAGALPTTDADRGPLRLGTRRAPDVRGQPATDTDGDRAINAAITPPRPLGVHHVKVPVTDLGRSRAWYESVFGIEMMIEFADDDGTVRGVAYAPINQLTLSLREDPERAAALAGFDSWAVLVDSRADLDAWAAHLDRLGIEHGPVLTATLGWLLACTDPDGIGVRFYTAERHG
jgi:catechol-2,3-dioxygenase